MSQVMNILGLNILGDKGMSNEGIALYAAQLKPHTCVVINNDKLAKLLLDQGVQVIYRHKSDKPFGNDDDAHLRYDPIEFVNLRHSEAPQGAVIHLTNEPGTGNVPKLNEWTLAAMKQCDVLGRKACILNFSTGNPAWRDWGTLSYSLEYARRHKHLIGHHDYFDRSMSRSMYEHVGRCLEIQQHLPGSQWVITELGCAIDYHPEKGWQEGLSQEVYADELIKIADLYAQHNIPVCIFSYGKWHSFGIEDAETLKQRLVAYHQHTPQANAITTAKLNVRLNLSTKSTVLKTLDKGTRICIDPEPLQGGAYTVSGRVMGDWYRIKTPVLGYVASAYVEKL